MTTMYTVHYENCGENGVLGVYADAIEATLAGETLAREFGLESPPDWETMRGGKVIDEGRDWPHHWVCTVCDDEGSECFVTITRLVLGAQP